MVAAPPPPPPCVPTEATIVAVRGRAAVYASAGARYGCYGSGAPVTLLLPASTTAPQPGRARLSRIALNGRYVAFVRSASAVDTGRVTVEVFDLRARARRERHNAIRRVGAPEFIESVGILRLRHDGAVAWISSGRSLGVAEARARAIPPGPPGPTREVHGARRGHDHVFGRSTTVVVSSLRLQDRFVLWRDGGLRRARL